MNELNVRLALRRLRIAPRSLRWRLQLWQGFLIVSMMAGFGVMIYQFQNANRVRQMDGDLELRLTALSRAIRNVYRDAPPGDLHWGAPPGRSGQRPENKKDGFSGMDSPPRKPPPDRQGSDFGGPVWGSPKAPSSPPPEWDHERPPPRESQDRDASSANDKAPFPLRRPPPLIRPRRPTAVPIPVETAQLFGHASGGYYFVIWYRDGTVISQSVDAPGNIPRPSAPERDTLPHYRTRGDYREAVHCSGFGDCVLAGRSIQSDLAASRAFGWRLLGAGIMILGLGFGLGWWLIGRAILPIEDISQAATRIAQGKLSERIDVGDLDDELGQLAAVLNSTFAQLEAAFVRQQQFTSNAAHELRTPLAILISEAQTALARERTAEEYRETVEGGLETAQQMRRITEALLQLARLDSTDLSVPRERVDLAAVSAVCVDRMKLAAQRNGIPINLQLAPAQAFVNLERIEVVMTNLMANALCYNKPGGDVTVSTYTENGTAILSVADTGIGIDAEDLPHVFDRFYRADKARSRSESHAGLGLAICKMMIEAEHGTVSAASTPHEGTTFTVRLPVRPAATSLGNKRAREL